MGDKKECPCQTVIDLQAKAEDQERRLWQGDTQFAVINTKLNILMAVLGAIGVSVVGVVVTLIF